MNSIVLQCVPIHQAPCRFPEFLEHRYYGFLSEKLPTSVSRNQTLYDGLSLKKQVIKAGEVKRKLSPFPPPPPPHPSFMLISLYECHFGHTRACTKLWSEISPNTTRLPTPAYEMAGNNWRSTQCYERAAPFRQNVLSTPIINSPSLYVPRNSF